MTRSYTFAGSAVRLAKKVFWTLIVLTAIVAGLIGGLVVAIAK